MNVDEDLYSRATARAIGAPVLAGAFYTQRSDDRSPASLPGGLIGAGISLWNLVAHAGRSHRRHLTHWMYLAVTADDVCRRSCRGRR